MENCGNLEYSTRCNDEGQLELEMRNSSDSQWAEIWISLPGGTEIIDPEGNLVYKVENDSDQPLRGRIRVPFQNA